MAKAAKRKVLTMSVNILGDTPKQQWLNAITIFETAITSNVDDVNFRLCNECQFPCEPEDRDECHNFHGLDVASKTTKDFANEMRRLIEGMFED